MFYPGWYCLLRVYWQRTFKFLNRICLLIFPQPSLLRDRLSFQNFIKFLEKRKCINLYWTKQWPHVNDAWNTISYHLYQMLCFMDYFELSHIVHELIFFLTLLWEQNIIWIFGNLRVTFLEKCDELSKLVAFAQNWGILQTRMDQRGEHMKMNFDYFQIPKWMLQTVRVEKVDEKNGL